MKIGNTSTPPSIRRTTALAVSAQMRPPSGEVFMKAQISCGKTNPLGKRRLLRIQSFRRTPAEFRRDRSMSRSPWRLFTILRLPSIHGIKSCEELPHFSASSKSGGRELRSRGGIAKLQQARRWRKSQSSQPKTSIGPQRNRRFYIQFNAIILTMRCSTSNQKASIRRWRRWSCSKLTQK